MERNNLELDFKQKLEQRTIQPTDMAWDRLDAMLSVSEKKKEPRKNYWMYIAASLLGFLLIGSLLLNLENETTGKASITTGSSVTDAGQPVGKQNHKGSAEAKDHTFKAAPLTSPVQNEAVAVRGKNIPHDQPFAQQRVLSRNVVKQEQTHTAITQPYGAVAVQEVHNRAVGETEDLLVHSLNDHTVPKKKSSVKVDPNSLLSSVEGELDQSFRSEVLNKVVKNYNTVKSSVANRNYQE